MAGRRGRRRRGGARGRPVVADGHAEGLPWSGTARRCCTARRHCCGRTVTGPVVVVVGADGWGHVGAARAARPGWWSPATPRPGLGPLQGIAAGLAAVARARRSGVRLRHRHAVPAPRVRAGRAGRAGRRRGAARRPRPPPAARRRLPGRAGAVGRRAARRGRPARPGSCSRAAGSRCSTTPRCAPTPPSPALDPELESLTNVNTPAEYAAARARPPAPVVVERAGVRRTVRAATLAEAGPGSGAPRSSVVLNGEPVAPDPLLPLVAGDTLVLR